MIASTLSRSKRILIVSPPYRLSQSSFPLGLMYIAAVLQKAGHRVDVIDMDVVNLSEKDYVRELRDRNYDYFCTGGMITAWNFVAFSSNMIKEIKPEVKIVIGGGIISSTPKSLLSVTKADVGVIGEGEEAILEIINAFENGRSLSTIEGIVYREDGQVVQTNPRHSHIDFDHLPFPAWDLFEVEKTYIRYPSHHSIFRARRSASIYTTRGCPFMCTFCYTEKAVRQRSVDNVIEELKELKNRFGARFISIADDLFVVRKKRTIEFCEAMIKNKMNLKWAATGRCNIVDPEFLKIMKRAGCEFLGLGIESGSDTVLKVIKKSQTPKQIVEAVKMVQKAGITPGGTFILGLPPETPETVRETVQIYKEINKYRSHVNRFFFATPYPGTELYDQMRQRGRISDEIAYFETLSERGDATDFCINCTEAFTDEELIKLKPKIEAEVFQDFMRKHPWYGFSQFLARRTPWEKIKNALIMFKMKGFREGVMFIVEKLMSKFKWAPNRYQRRWNFRVGYTSQQTLFEGRVNTF